MKEFMKARRTTSNKPTTVTQAARFLDIDYPGWGKWIDVKKLTYADACILDQIFGSGRLAAYAIYAIYGTQSGVIANGMPFGYTTGHGEKKSKCKLHKAWMRAIKARLPEAPKAIVPASPAAKFTRSDLKTGMRVTTAEDGGTTYIILGERIQTSTGMRMRPISDYLHDLEHKSPTDQIKNITAVYAAPAGLLPEEFLDVNKKGALLWDGKDAIRQKLQKEYAELKEQAAEIKKKIAALA